MSEKKKLFVEKYKAVFTKKKNTILWFQTRKGIFKAAFLGRQLVFIMHNH